MEGVRDADWGHRSVDASREETAEEKHGVYYAVGFGDVAVAGGSTAGVVGMAEAHPAGRELGEQPGVDLGQQGPGARRAVDTLLPGAGRDCTGPVAAGVGAGAGRQEGEVGSAAEAVALAAAAAVASWDHTRSWRTVALGQRGGPQQQLSLPVERIVTRSTAHRTRQQPLLVVARQQQRPNRQSSRFARVEEGADLEGEEAEECTLLSRKGSCSLSGASSMSTAI